MKFKLNGIRFSVWRYLFFFALSVVLMLGILQIAFIGPYYRDSKVKTIYNVADLIQANIIDQTYVSEKDIQNSFQISVNNNLCALIYNENGKMIYSVDSLGVGCIFNQNITINDIAFLPNENGLPLINQLVPKKEVTITIDNTLTDQEMIIYGKKIKANLGNYYLFVNSPLEPVESIVNFIIDQYFYFTILIVGLAFIVSLLIAQKISNPIVKMQKSAKRLAKGKYDTSFDGNSYSEINDLADTLNDATQKLNQIEELRKDLIANVSHDIKTPLTMIKAYAEMIKDISGDNPEKRKEHLDVIIKETEYLDNLVVDMLNLSKMEAGVVHLNRQNFNLTSKVEDTILSFDILLMEKEIELIEEVDDNVIIYADEIKLSQVLYNFISNAIKHTPIESTIIVRLHETEEAIRFEVEDNGPGINEKDLPYIWDRYYKIDKQFARKETGTGLGLAISKNVLQAHGAKFGVISNKGGAIFWFEINKGINDENI